MDPVRIYSVLDREARLVLAISDEPGHFHLTRPPDVELVPIECAYATLQCYDARAEPDLLRMAFEAHDLEELLERLKARGFRVLDGRIQAKKIARL